jgi:hypothetical protein
MSARLQMKETALGHLQHRHLRDQKLIICGGLRMIHPGQFGCAQEAGDLVVVSL